MSRSEHPSPAAPAGSPAPAPIRVTCPHCGQPLDVIPVRAAQPPAGEPLPSQTASPMARLSRTVVRAVQRRLFPLSSTLEPAADAAPAAPPQRWGTIALIIAGIVLVGALLMWWGRPSATPGATVATPTVPSSNSTATEAAILDTLTRYNRAESEAAARLSIEPLRPFIDPSGPFAQRRAAQLAERQQRNAPHRTVLVRWAVGQIAVEGTTATVVTQETWSNQEAGAVAPEQATVRVTYTLRWDATTGRWVIVNTNQIPL